MADITRGNFKITVGRKEIKEKAAEAGQHITGYYDGDREFYSNTVTIAGKTYGKGSRGRTGTVKAMQQDTEEIPGLFCPDCNAQAYKTDHPTIAVCGDYPGWYFFFRKIDRAVDNKPKYVIKNGELVEVTESEAIQNE